MTVIASVGACVSVLTVLFVAWRERRESSARAEQRAKSIIDLLRIAENASEPAGVREFAKRELRRMKARLEDDDQESLINRVFGSAPMADARDQLDHTPTEPTEELDPDTERLLTVMKWWSGTSPYTRLEENRIRVGFLLAFHVALFVWLGVVAIQRALLHPT